MKQETKNKLRLGVACTVSGLVTTFIVGTIVVYAWQVLLFSGAVVLLLGSMVLIAWSFTTVADWLDGKRY